jgi:hypothetical protein
LICLYGLEAIKAHARDAIPDEKPTRQSGRFRSAQWGGIDDGADELVPAATNGAYVALRATVVAECTPGALDPTRQSGLANEAATPNGVEELVLGDHALMIADQLRHDIEHLRLHPDRNSVAAQLEPRNIQNEVIEVPHHEWG